MPNEDGFHGLVGARRDSGGGNEIQAESRAGGKKIVGSVARSVWRVEVVTNLRSQGKKPRPAEIFGSELLVKKCLIANSS